MTDAGFLMVLTGNDYSGGDEDIKRAVAERAKMISHTFTPERDACYDGNRCKPENLGWRLIQNCKIGFGAKKGTIITIEKIREGLLDVEIEETWREAGRAEYHYRYEKDWG